MDGKTKIRYTCSVSRENIMKKTGTIAKQLLASMFAILVLSSARSICQADEIADLKAKAQNSFTHGDYDSAIDCYTRLIQLKVSGVYFSRGLAYLDKNEFDKAILDLNEAVVSMSNAPVFMLRGEAYSGKQDHLKAVEDFTKAINLSPQSGIAYKLRAEEYLFYIDHINAGLIDCHTFFLLAPLDQHITPFMVSQAYYDMGYGCECEGEYEKAYANYTKSILAYPKYDVPYINRGLLFVYKGEYDKAINDYEQAIQITPNSKDAINRLSWLRSTCPDEKYRDGQKALADMRKLCDMTQWTNSDVLNTYAAANAEVGDFAMAVKWEQQAIETGLADRQIKAAPRWLELYQQHKPCRDVIVKVQ